MDILIDDIPDEGLRIAANASSDAWLSHVVGDCFSKGLLPEDSATLEIFCSKLNRNVEIEGAIACGIRTTCDRCLKEFAFTCRIPLHLHFSPLYESESQRIREEEEDVEVVRDDDDFSFYDGDRLCLDDIVREHILLTKPIQLLCQENCLGLCPRCGADLNGGACGCKTR